MKTFKELREGAAPFVRSPLDKKVWNQNVLMDPKKFSIPTQDDKLFKATNINHMAARKGDQDNAEDQSTGYHTPIMFGDYLEKMLNYAAEGYELPEDDKLFLEMLADMPDDEFQSLLESEVPPDDEDDNKKPFGNKLNNKPDDEDEDEDEDDDAPNKPFGNKPANNKPAKSDANDVTDSEGIERPNFGNKGVKEDFKSDLARVDAKLAAWDKSNGIVSRDIESAKKKVKPVPHPLMNKVKEIFTPDDLPKIADAHHDNAELDSVKARSSAFKHDYKKVKSLRNDQEHESEKFRRASRLMKKTGMGYHPADKRSKGE